MAERLELSSGDWRSSREFFDEIKEALDQVLDPTVDRYDFSWLGKRESILAAALPTSYRLICDVDSSNNFEQTGNLAIIGDNLDALKLLQESYYRQVKMIYIDPPYNTGHDLVSAQTIELHMEEDAAVVETKSSLVTNSKTRPDFHSNWLSMMCPRLMLAKNLLTEDGAIFISIDQNEFANLKKLCDEIFGEENFLALTMRQKNRVVMKSNKAFKNYLEPVLVYARDKNKLNLTYTKPEADKNDFSLISAGYGRKEVMFYPGQLHFAQPLDMIKAQKYPNCEVLNAAQVIDGVNQQAVTIRGEFKWGQTTIQSKLRRGAIVQIKNPGTMNLRLQMANTTATPQDYINEQYGLVTNDDGMNELAALNLGQYFSYPKPSQLVQFFVNLMQDREAIVMDFFAGSGTTGQAVLQQNALDGGKRKYILVQMEEPIDTPQVKRPRIKTVDQLMLERLRRVGERIRKESQTANLDTGLRVFRLRDENEKRQGKNGWREETEAGRKEAAGVGLVFRAVVALGLPLHLPLQECKTDTVGYYLYDYDHPHSGVAFCLEEMNEEVLTEILRRQPGILVLSDKVFVDEFADDEGRAKVLQKCEKMSPDTQVKVIE